MGTWAQDVDKPTAVRAVTRFVARLRRNSRHRLEYACTWELTKRGRLHVNLIIAPWTYIPSTTLARWWQDVGGGPNIWIKRVGAGIGQEAAKSREDAAYYFAKWEQMVKTGRAANYSKGWPKLPDTDAPLRRGHIIYEQEQQRPSWMSPPELDPNDIQLRLWTETHEHEWQSRLMPRCDCFDYVLAKTEPTAHGPPQ